MNSGVSIKSKPLKDLSILLAAVLFVFIAIWNQLPIEDKYTYFNFADSRCILKIDNFSDVISNIAFTAVGIFGIFIFWRYKKLQILSDQIILLSLSTSLVLVSVGSAYFHFLPTPERLFWDRVPMVFAFMSMVSLLISDRIQQKIGFYFLLILTPICVFILALWRLQYINLRPYLMIQFGSLLFIFFICLFRPHGQLKNRFVIGSFVFYALAKVVEKYDLEIFNMTGFMSGHTLKHLLAALSVYLILFHINQNLKLRNN